MKNELKVNEFCENEARIVFDENSIKNLFDIEINELELIDSVEIATHIHIFTGGRDIVTQV